MAALSVLVVGCGNMGSSHARAYHQLKDDFRVVGLVARGAASRDKLSQELGGVPTFADFETAYKETKPDVVSINTYPDTHAKIARTALAGGSHIFIEKPLAETVAEAEEIAALALARCAPVSEIEVAIRKWATGVPGDPEWVGVTIVRRR